MRKAIKAEKFFLLGFALLSLGLAVAVFATSRSASAAGLRDRLARAELYSDPFSPPNERVVNGAFESGVSTPDAWTPCPGAAAWDNTAAHDGTHSARVTTCAWQSDGILYLSSGTWSIGYWHKEDSSVQWVGATVVCGGVSQTVGAPAFGDSLWHYYNRYIILGSACDSNLPRIRLTGSTDAAGAQAGPAGAVWYDQVSLAYYPDVGDIPQPPSVDWMAPTGNQQILVVACAATPQLLLQISATTYASLTGTFSSGFPRKLDHVDFWRFDVATQKYDLNPFATVTWPPPGNNALVEGMASTTLNVCSLPTTESDITADVYDRVGNHSFQFIRVFGGTPLWLPLIAR